MATKSYGESDCFFVIERKAERKREYINFDRIDIQCEISPVPFSLLSKMEPGESSANIPNGMTLRMGKLLSFASQKIASLRSA